MRVVSKAEDDAIKKLQSPINNIDMWTKNEV